MREFLIDVSRLIWRLWAGRIPTGIDRVCLAYVERFGNRAQAVVQRRGTFFVLSPAHSDRLFRLFGDGRPVSRADLLRVMVASAASTRRSPPAAGTIYLNVGHTGLDERALPAWIARNRLRAVYLVHDLIPLTHPEFCRAGEAEKHRRRMANVLASAAGVIGNSQATIDELRAFAEATGAEMPRSVAAWLGGSSAVPDVRPRSLPRPYFVTVGTIEGRKNHLLLLDVWRSLVAKLGEAAPVLMIIGQRGWQADPVLEQLDRLGDLEGHVNELGACDDRELSEWVAGARAVLMPSFAEGFGLPVIESLQLGTPVIASDLPVFREIADGIPTYLDPLDRAAWERTIASFTGDGPERERQLAQIPSYRAPDWTGHFHIVEDWLKSLGSIRKSDSSTGSISRLESAG